MGLRVARVRQVARSACRAPCLGRGHGSTKVIESLSRPPSRPVSLESPLDDLPYGFAAVDCVLSGVGIALERCGIQKRKDTLRMITGAAPAVEVLESETAWQPAFPVVLEMLKEQAVHWSSSKG